MLACTVPPARRRPPPTSPLPGDVDRFLDHNISDEVKKKILWDNSVKLYGERVLAKN